MLQDQKKKRRKFKTGPRPTADEPWKIKKCLNCNLEECTNCFSTNESKKEHKKGYKKNSRISFFGEMLTITQIAEKTGISRNKLYSYKKTGGAKHIEKKARENGYNERLCVCIQDGKCQCKSKSIIEKDNQDNGRP